MKMISARQFLAVSGEMRAFIQTKERKKATPGASVICPQSLFLSLDIVVPSSGCLINAASVLGKGATFGLIITTAFKSHCREKELN